MTEGAAVENDQNDGEEDDPPLHERDAESDTEARPPTQAPGYDIADPESREFGLRGWGLVAALVVSFIVIPWTIIGLPAAGEFLETLPLGWRDAYLVLPFVPAVFLGALGAWTALANRRRN